MRLPILIAASLFVLYGCANKPDPPGEAPTGVTATPGDGLILMSWDQRPDLTYWIFYAPGGTVSPGQLGSIALKDAVSPRAVTGLVNGTQYALIMNATNQGSAAGPNSQVVLGNPRLAGNLWAQGSVQGAQNLNALAFNGAGRYVTVGDGSTIFAGDFNYGHTNPVGVTTWFTPTTSPAITWFANPPFFSTIPPGGTTIPPFTDDFKAVNWNGTFSALGSNGNVATSADGVNWVPWHRVLAAGVTGLNGLSWGNTSNGPEYLAVGDGGQMYTTNNLTIDWTPVTSLGTTSDLTSITFVNSGFFIITGADGTLLVSPDGVNWTPQTINPPLPPGTTLRSVAFMQNAVGIQDANQNLAINYVVVGDNNTVITATQITRDVNNIPSGDWTVNPLPSVNAPSCTNPPNPSPPPNPPLNLRSVTVGGSTGLRFLAVGQGGAALFGDSVINDPTTGALVPVLPIQWCVASQPPTGDFSSVHFFLGQYLTLGAAGANAVSH